MFNKKSRITILEERLDLANSARGRDIRFLQDDVKKLIEQLTELSSLHNQLASEFIKMAIQLRSLTQMQINYEFENQKVFMETH